MSPISPEPVLPEAQVWQYQEPAAGMQTSALPDGAPGLPLQPDQSPIPAPVSLLSQSISPPPAPIFSNTAQNVSTEQPQGSTNPPPVYGLSAASAAQSVQAAKRKKTRLFIMAGMAVVVVAGGAFLAFSLIKNGGLKLEQKSETAYSVLVPKGYDEKSEQGMVIYEEKEGDEDTHSGVIVFYQEYPGGKAPTSQQKETVLSAIEDLPKSVLSAQGKSTTGFKSERTTFKKNDAVKFSAHTEEGDKGGGDLKGIVILGDKSLYMVFVAAHQSDPGVMKKMDNILNSFEINE